MEGRVEPRRNRNLLDERGCGERRLMEERKDNWGRIGGCENGEEEDAGKVEERKSGGKEGFGHKLRLLRKKESWPMQE